jgi:hypothetical protein
MLPCLKLFYILNYVWTYKTIATTIIIVTNASKQIPKGIKTACTDSLELKPKELLNNEIHCINSQQKKRRVREPILKDTKQEENIKKLALVSIHAPYNNFPPQWLVTLAKQELSKKMLESKSKERTINIEV